MSTKGKSYFFRGINCIKIRGVRIPPGEWALRVQVVHVLLGIASQTHGEYSRSIPLLTLKKIQFESWTECTSSGKQKSS